MGLTQHGRGQTGYKVPGKMRCGRRSRCLLRLYLVRAVSTGKIAVDMASCTPRPHPHVQTSLVPPQYSVTRGIDLIGSAFDFGVESCHECRRSGHLGVPLAE
jgi:hypothetical protein